MAIFLGLQPFQRKESSGWYYQMRSVGHGQGRALSQCGTNGNVLIVVPNPQHTLKTFPILLLVECSLQMERVHEWLLLPCRTFGGVCFLDIHR